MEKINVYFHGESGVPAVIHEEVKSFRDEIRERTGVKLTLQRIYVELIKTGLKNKPLKVDIYEDEN